MIRMFDLILSLTGLVLLLPLFSVLFFCCLLDTGSPIFKQERLGRFKKPFFIYKFRTMVLGTPSQATHLVNQNRITGLGRFLRKFKLDELPQLWNVLTGDMSLVGPRPCLIEQHDVIGAREVFDIFDARPGITGLAQIKGIHMSNAPVLAKHDAYMLNHMSVAYYFIIIAKTFLGKSPGDPVH